MVTISAIFFALTIGLVVGSLSVSPQVVRSQSNLLKALNTKVSNDIEEREQELGRYRKCLAVIFPQAIHNKLIGRSVAIIVVGDYPDEVTPLRDALEQAGAQVTGVLTIDRNFARPDAQLTAKLLELHGDDARAPKDRAALASLLSTTLARGDLDPVPILPFLDRADLVHVEPNSNFQLRATDVIFLSGTRSENSDRTEYVDQPLAAALQKSGLNVAMCEPRYALFSDVPAYRALNIDVGSVDDVDSDIGRCAVVYVLMGAKDDYGVKATAKDLIPPAPDPVTSGSVMPRVVR